MIKLKQRKQLFLLRIIAIIFFFFAFFNQNAICAENYIVKDLKVDASDKMIFIEGQGNYKLNQNDTYVPVPTQNSSSIKLMTDITTFSITNPSRFVVDIPNAVLIGANRNFKIQNSKTIKNIQLSQFSTMPNIVRIVFTTINNTDLSKFKVYSNGENIIVKYNNQIIENSIQYKFYTPDGDYDKTNLLQNTNAILSYNNSFEMENIIPIFQTKYHLSQISQNSDGLILRGLGSISLQRATYSPDNTTASIIIDNASVVSRLENKTYKIPSSNPDYRATLTINKINSRKIKLTLNGEA